MILVVQHIVAQLFNIRFPTPLPYKLLLIMPVNLYPYRIDSVLLEALANYQVMVEKWKARASTSDNPTNDCMGVARTFFCTQAFPGCNDDEDVR